MITLQDYSRRVILRHQHPGGAYPACPTMPDYQFSWFRDGSFIAFAMLGCGEATSANAFYAWAARTLLRYEKGARRAVADVQAGRRPNPQDILRARYTYDGGKGPDDWPEFQLDGLGTWLWTLSEFAIAGNALSEDVLQAANLVADYLLVLWKLPCHDLWEEFGERIHTYTLGAIFGGLNAAAALLNRPELALNALQIQRFILMNAIQPDGSFAKSLDYPISDGSLTAMSTPYRVVVPSDPIMCATIERIERDLHAVGYGVHRYTADTYYGGGAWLLLAAWLGWYYSEVGELGKARGILNAIEKCAFSEGDLPEQVVPPMLAVETDYTHWVRVRGPIASPLLWSHAMYLLLEARCRY